MPFVNIKVTDEGVTAVQKAALIQGATQLLVNVLHKNPQTTVVLIDEVNTDNWGIGGETVTARRQRSQSPAPPAAIPDVITGQENPDELPFPAAALVQFYAAFNGGDLAMMADNWANTADIAMDNPVGGIMRGWEAIRGVYERIFNGPAQVYVEYYDFTIHETGEMFYAVGRERGEFRLGDTAVPLAIRTSRIFQRIDGRWRQVHHHGSIDDPDLLARYQTAVRGGTPYQVS
ncbi:MAG: 2-hydroxymuconate tautomerase family protein [Ardenticatenaceae bacterium]|nr:2-hydroxymuconate tautomerase family protein [Ardenticatenaceae bacterium]MCB9003387.1 2-hydroxymuconate tautomerase family protein [Ardenticatenaceae bacterium]